ncbi:MAG: hypothetical protein AAF713_02960 [Pseudomonadota bacterium]
METQLFTVHSRGKPDEFLAIGDGRRPLGILPPVWAIWRGLWITALAMVALLVATAALHTALTGTVWVGLIAITVFDGATLERLERRLRGWREVALVEARTEEGAEELYLTGQTA